MDVWSTIDKNMNRNGNGTSISPEMTIFFFKALTLLKLNCPFSCAIYAFFLAKTQPDIPKCTFSMADMEGKGVVSIRRRHLRLWGGKTRNIEN